MNAKLTTDESRGSVSTLSFRWVSPRHLNTTAIEPPARFGAPATGRKPGPGFGCCRHDPEWFMHKPWPRVLCKGEGFPADWKRCQCPTRAGDACPIEADREWQGLAVCHVHDPNGKMCAGNPSAREYAVTELARRAGA